MQTLQEDRMAAMAAQFARWQGGETAALSELVRHSYEQLQTLARKALRQFPGVHRWDGTDDVLHNSLVRLLEAMRKVRPTSVAHFLSLAARHIRWELLDLKRHYFGPEGLGANHATHPAHDGAFPEPPAPPTPADQDWFGVHEMADQLPDKEQQVLDLLVYQGLTQKEAATLLEVTEKTIHNRFSAAKLRLRDLMQKL